MWGAFIYDSDFFFQFICSSLKQKHLYTHIGGEEGGQIYLFNLALCFLTG